MLWSKYNFVAKLYYNIWFDQWGKVGGFSGVEI
jgi:hypothetical protein